MIYILQILDALDGLDIKKHTCQKNKIIKKTKFYDNQYKLIP